MKNINYYMALPYKMEIVEDKDEGGYVVSYPDLPGCITCGETIETAVANANDAKMAWIEAALESGIEIQEPNNLVGLVMVRGQFRFGHRSPWMAAATMAARLHSSSIASARIAVSMARPSPIHHSM